MQDLIIQAALALLKDFINKDVFLAIEKQLCDLIKDQLSKTPQVVKDAEQGLICYLAGLAAKTDNSIDDKLVQIISDALGTDITKCPAPAPAPEAE